MTIKTRILSVFALVLVFLSSFSIFSSAAETPLSFPPTFSDAASGHPEATGGLTAIIEAVPISDIASGTDVAVWIYCPNGVSLVSDSFVAFGRNGETMLPPYPENHNLIAYGNYLVCFYKSADWQKLINNTYPPDRVSFYVAISFPYPEPYICGVSGVSEFFQHFDTKKYNDGYNAGYDVGHEAGVSLGYDEGYSNGNYDGYKDGYAKGETDGIAVVEKGQKAWYKMLFDVVDAPVAVLRSMFNFEIFGVNMQPFLFSILTLCLVIAVIKFLI